MGQITLTKEIKAPPERVFEVMSELSEAPKRIPAIKRLEVLTPGPVGKGTRFRETRIMFGKEATETMEITDFQPGKAMTVSANSCGAIFNTTFHYSRAGSGTLVEQTTSWKPVSLFARLMTPLSMLMMGSMKKMLQKDLDDIAASLERGG